jgi:cytochrome b561-like protein
MRRPERLRPKTDLGTIVLHWLLVGALFGAIATGLSLANEAPDHDWIAALDGIPPQSGIYAGHLRSALMLIVVAIAYPIYMWRAALVPRIRLDAVRLRGLSDSRYCWATVNVVLNWVCYLTVLIAILTGGLLYFDRGGPAVVEIHWLATWTIIAIAPVHVLAHFAFGGVPQLLRLFRPVQLARSQPHFDSYRHRVRQGGRRCRPRDGRVTDIHRRNTESD